MKKALYISLKKNKTQLKSQLYNSHLVPLCVLVNLPKIYQTRKYLFCYRKIVQE